MAAGDLGPHGEGEWLTLKEAETRTGIKYKTLYRQATRGRRPWKMDAARDLVMVWVQAQEPRSPAVPEPEETEEPDEEPRSLAVPLERELFLAMLERMERAISPLTDRIEELARENEQLRNVEEQRSQEREQLEAERDTARQEANAAEARAAQLAADLAAEREKRRWRWRWW